MIYAYFEILENSGLNQKAEHGEMFIQDHFIIGDNAYPLTNWLITPFKKPDNLNRQQLVYIEVKEAGQSQ